MVIRTLAVLPVLYMAMMGGQRQGRVCPGYPQARRQQALLVIC